MPPFLYTQPFMRVLFPFVHPFVRAQIHLR